MLKSSFPGMTVECDREVFDTCADSGQAATACGVIPSANSTREFVGMLLRTATDPSCNNSKLNELKHEHFQNLTLIVPLLPLLGSILAFFSLRFLKNDIFSLLPKRSLRNRNVQRRRDHSFTVLPSKAKSC